MAMAMVKKIAEEQTRKATKKVILQGTGQALLACGADPVVQVVQAGLVLKKVLKTAKVVRNVVTKLQSN